MLTVKDIMTTEVFTIRSSAPVARAIAIMQEKKLRGLIVEKEYAQGSYGMVTERDIVYNVTAHALDPHTVCIAEIMSKPCITMGSDLTLNTAAHRFAEYGIQRAPVVEGQTLLGVISITDIIMKSDVSEVELPDDLSEQIKVALQHVRLSWDEEEQVRRECDAVWDVVEELDECRSQKSLLS